MWGLPWGSPKISDLDDGAWNGEGMFEYAGKKICAAEEKTVDFWVLDDAPKQQK